MNKTIILSGRIDSNNAGRIQEEIFAELQAEKAPEAITVDADALDYISSAGLRVLMKLRKDTGIVPSIVNTSDEVYNIFETTGFTEMFDVQKKLREISVEGCKLIGQGANGKVYRLDEDKIVKLYDYIGLDMVKREKENARKVLASGVPCVIPYDVVKSGDKYGLVFEMLDCDTLGHIFAENPDRFDELSDKYVQLAKALHSVHIGDGRIRNIKTTMRENLDVLREWCTDEEVSIMAEVEERIPMQDNLLHNDLHPGNIMVQDGEFLLIDMADMMIGPEIFDMASTFRMLAVMPKMNREVTEQVMGMPADMIGRLCDSFFTGYTGITDPAKMGEYMGKLNIAFAINSMIMLSLRHPVVTVRAQWAVDYFLHKTIIPNMDRIPALFE